MNPAPHKPWEGSITSTPGGLYSQPSVPMAPTILGGPSTRTLGPPPLPPRSAGIGSPHSSLAYRGMNRYSSYPYGRNSYLPNQWNMWNYRGGYDSMEGSLSQSASEAWNPTFSSVENLLHAFSSMSYLLESSYQAIQMSFQAVLSVADNMAKMKNFLLELLASLAALRTIRGFYRWLRRLLGLATGIEEEAWAAAAAGPPRAPGQPLWPMAAFLGLMFGGPYVLYKVFSPTVPTPTWDPEESPGIPVTAAWKFKSLDPSELSFQKGETLVVAPPPYNKQRCAWVLACNSEKKLGLIPLNRVQRQARPPDQPLSS